MTARPSLEELELAPLLAPTSYESAEMTDTDKRDSVEDELDVEKLERASTQSVVREVSVEEKKLVRKLDIRIMSIASALYLCACESSQSSSCRWVTKASH